MQKTKVLISDFKILERLVKPFQIYNIYHFKPIDEFCIDSRCIKRGQAYIAIKGKHHDGHKFIQEAVKKGAALVIAQKYIPIKPKVPFFIVEDTYRALSSIATYIRKIKKPFVYAITGSMGKTTTKEMLSFLLEPQFQVLKNEKTENNILGVAKTIFSLKDEKALILELGTNAKGEIKSLAKMCLPDVGIIIFIKPVHLEGLGSLSEIRDEKLSLLGVNSKMKVILNRDDSFLSKVKTKHKVYWFGKAKNNYIFARLIRREEKNSVFLVQEKHELKVASYLEPFISNILAAVSAASLAGLPLKDLVEKMNQFKGFLPMRMQMQKVKGFSILNDAYNANPHSFHSIFKALENYPFKKIAVVADMLELGQKSIYYHQQLAPWLIKGDFDYCLTFGDYSSYLARKLQKLGYKGAFHFSSHKAIAGFINERIGTSAKLKKRYLIFLKGSRKMELEKVIRYLK